MSILDISDFPINTTQVETRFSLIYFLSPTNSAPGPSDIVGPKLFLKKEDAEKRLFTFFKNGIIESLIDTFIEYATNNVDVRSEVLDNITYDTMEDSFDELFKQNPDSLNIDVLSAWYAANIKDVENLHFYFKLEEIPIQSFEDEINRAIGFYANGKLTDQFTIRPYESLKDDSEIFFEVVVNNGDMTSGSYYMSYSDVQDAVFNVESQCWESYGNEFKIVTEA